MHLSVTHRSPLAEDSIQRSMHMLQDSLASHKGKKVMELKGEGRGNGGKLGRIVSAKQNIK